MAVAVLGLGRMGRAVTGRLLSAGIEVTVWNRSPGREGDLLARGATTADSLTDAVRGADVVLCSLSGDGAVHDVLLPGGRAIDELDGTVVDCSTVAPNTSTDLAGAYPERFVACPVAGSPSAVAQGQATLIVAGTPFAIDRADAVLNALSHSQLRVGDDVATAATVKLLNNYLLMSGLAALADAVAVARGNGVSNAALADLLTKLAVVPPGLHNRIGGLLERDHDGWFSVELAAKDLGLFDELAARVGVRPGLADAVGRYYQDTCELGLGDRDLTAIIESVEGRPPPQ